MLCVQKHPVSTQYINSNCGGQVSEEKRKKGTGERKEGHSLGSHGPHYPPVSKALLSKGDGVSFIICKHNKPCLSPLTLSICTHVQEAQLLAVFS